MVNTRALFADHNLRCTQQRCVIFETLRECGSHPTAEELYGICRSRIEHVSLATVYNTLEALCESGLCRKLLTVGGSCRYDADMSDHFHVRFQETDELLDVPHDIGRRLMNGLSESVLAEIEQRLGVSIVGMNIQFVASREPGFTGNSN